MHTYIMYLDVNHVPIIMDVNHDRAWQNIFHSMCLDTQENLVIISRVQLLSQFSYHGTQLQPDEESIGEAHSAAGIGRNLDG